MMADLLVYGLPWWLQAALGAAVAVPILLLATRFIGVARALKGGVALAGLLAAFALERRARQAGWIARAQKEARDADELLGKAEQARAAADAAAARDPAGLRDDDGFRRG